MTQVPCELAVSRMNLDEETVRAGPAGPLRLHAEHVRVCEQRMDPRQVVISPLDWLLQVAVLLIAQAAHRRHHEQPPARYGEHLFEGRKAIGHVVEGLEADDDVE